MELRSILTVRDEFTIPGIRSSCMIGRLCFKKLFIVVVGFVLSLVLLLFFYDCVSMRRFNCWWIGACTH